MSEAWLTLGLLAVATAVLRAFGPLVAGGRVLPAAATRVLALVAPALLGAIVVTQTLGGEGGAVVLDARLVGLGAAAAALALRAPLLVVILVAAAAAALVRAF